MLHFPKKFHFGKKFFLSLRMFRVQSIEFPWLRHCLYPKAESFEWFDYIHIEYLITNYVGFGSSNHNSIKSYIPNQCFKCPFLPSSNQSSKWGFFPQSYRFCTYIFIFEPCIKSMLREERQLILFSLGIFTSKIFFFRKLRFFLFLCQIPRWAEKVLSLGVIAVIFYSHTEKGWKMEHLSPCLLNKWKNWLDF